MRKKLFAVIMSAMMMVTFMPAMAFAVAGGTEEAKTGFFVAGKNVADATVTYNAGSYDGVAAEVTYVVKTSTTQTFRGYQMKYSATDAGLASAKFAAETTTAPTIKDAGYYTVRAIFVEAGSTGEGVINPAVVKYEDLKIKVAPRQVLVSAKNSTVSLLKEKNYDGKGFVIGDADFNFTPKWNEKTNAYDLANTGLVAGDTVFVKAVETPADAGVYEVTKLSHWTNINPNYEVLVETTNHGTRGFIGSLDAKSFKAVILKADNNVTLSKSNKTYTAKALKKAKKSFKINPKATWGDVKVTKVSGSGYLYLNGNKVVVKKGAKKGTYQIKVKAYVVGNSNYASASLTKVINVKVK